MTAAEPNLHACPQCGWVVDIGGDDMAGDEDAVAARIAHQCRAAWVDVTLAQDEAEEVAYLLRGAYPSPLRTSLLGRLSSALHPRGAV